MIPIERSLALIAQYGGNEEAHHKQWVLDQVVRILTASPIVRLRALDYQDQPYEYEALGKSQAYLDWVRDVCAGEDGPETYSWDEGIAP